MGSLPGFQLNFISKTTLQISNDSIDPIHFYSTFEYMDTYVKNDYIFMNWRGGRAAVEIKKDMTHKNLPARAVL